MIHDVDETLRALVRRDVTNGGGIDVSFEAPTREWAAQRQGPAINLYLYDVREDLERRGAGLEEIRDERGIVVERRRPPRRFRLSYLVTAWTQRAEDEHRLLAALLRSLVDADALPTDLLHGELVDVAEPIPITVALPTKDRSLSDVWSALGGELKPSLDLVVLTPFGTRSDRAVGPPVLEGPVVNLFGPDGQLLDRRTRRARDAADAAGGAPAPPGAAEVVDGATFATGSAAAAAAQDRVPEGLARRVAAGEPVPERSGMSRGRRIAITTVPPERPTGRP